jgi:hypothetical protein
VAWFPLLILATIEGHSLGSTGGIPFLLDYVVHSRFLIAVPLLVIAEAIVGQKIRGAVRYFQDAEIIAGDDLPRLKAAAEEAVQNRDSVVMELVLLFAVYAWAIIQLFMAGHLFGEGRTWQGVTTNTGEVLSLAGWWFRLVSLPIFQFLWLRWIWRIVLWSKFLRSVSRMPLRLTPTHPDAAGGLSFLGRAHGSFGLIGFSLGVGLAAVFARTMLVERVTLLTLRIPVATFVLLCLAVFLGPLLAFTPVLIRVKRKGLNDYGKIALAYGRQFDEKWVQGGVPSDGQALGSADIQSLADMVNSYEAVRKMSIVPVDRKTVFKIAAASVAPMVPLAFLEIPADEVIKILLKVLA